MIAGVVLAGCSPLTFAGKIAGNVAGRKVAEVTPAPSTAVVVDPKGGNFCDVMPKLGWPPVITDDRLNRPLANAVVGTLEHGEKECAWKQPTIP